MAETMYDKIWARHLVRDGGSDPSLLYIDRHFVHEVTSPQAFAGLRMTGRTLRRPELTYATMDHNVSTRVRDLESAEKSSRQQMQVLKDNCAQFQISLFDLQHPDNGIVHVIGPELGLTLPGMTIVCGDSHTSTHGAFGSLGFGIGTSEVEHVLATQTLRQSRSKNMLVQLEGKCGVGISAKDIILAIIGKVGVHGGRGFVIEYAGQAIKDLSMEGRMTVCNMSIEAGARAGLIAPDETTFAYIKGRRFAPKGQEWQQAVEEWRTFPSDPGAHYDCVVTLHAAQIEPQVTWGTNPSQVTHVNGRIPFFDEIEDRVERATMRSSLQYMGLEEGMPISSIQLDRVFIGSCTNARLEDLRLAAEVVKGRQVSPDVKAMVVPGSSQVRRQAEEEGLDRVFMEAGFEWRQAGCSMCLGMNDDILQPKERCASTSNRNFEGRQGRGGRTHLVSPVMAAAAAVMGRFVDIRQWS